MKVEFIYEKTCPNIAPTREQLAHAFGQLGMAPTWQEWEVHQADTPAHIHGYGSPTILIDGIDLLDAQPVSDDMSCRIYPDSPAANHGVPSLELLMTKLRASAGIVSSPSGKKAKSLFGFNLSLLPTIGVALLPKLFCPACWPAYAGLLSSMGLGFFDYTPYMQPIMLGFIAIALTGLFYRASRRRGYGPFLLGVVASGLLMYSKFYIDNDPLMWVSLVLLVMASLWNTWPKTQTGGVCTTCVS